MYSLTPFGQQKIHELAQRYGVSADAALALLRALVHNNGTMAQFNHPELGGSGQWMRGGMTMVGDMFNHALKAKVDGLCFELSELLAKHSLFAAAPPPPGQGGGWQQQQHGGGSPMGGSGVSLFVPQGAGGAWWPASLGSPNASGAQNNVRYAYFAGPRRLAVEINGRTTVYDAGDHQISGISQQQGGSASVAFTSQHGLIDIERLPVVSEEGSPSAPQAAPASPSQHPPPAAGANAASAEDLFAKIERLAELKQKGILSEEEFAAKKAELLARI